MLLVVMSEICKFFTKNLLHVKKMFSPIDFNGSDSPITNYQILFPSKWDFVFISGLNKII